MIYGTTSNGPVILDAKTGADRSTFPGAAPVAVNEYTGVALDERPPADRLTNRGLQQGAGPAVCSQLAPSGRWAPPSGPSSPSPEASFRERSLSQTRLF